MTWRFRHRINVPTDLQYNRQDSLVTSYKNLSIIESSSGYCIRTTYCHRDRRNIPIARTYVHSGLLYERTESVVLIITQQRFLGLNLVLKSTTRAGSTGLKNTLSSSSLAYCTPLLDVGLPQGTP